MLILFNAVRVLNPDSVFVCSPFQKSLHNLQKLRGLFRMQPMARSGDFGEGCMRKNLLDGRFIRLHEVVTIASMHEWGPKNADRVRNPVSVFPSFSPLQKSLNNFQKLRGLLGMKPVTSPRNFGKGRMGKNLLDGGFIRFCQVMAIAAMYE